MIECVYLQRMGKGNHHGCQLHVECTIEPDGGPLACCTDCKQRTCLGDQDFADKWVDQLKVTTRDKRDANVLRNMLQGGTSFLVCGGPSAKEHLHKLNRRGVFALAVNNAAGHIVRPQAFVCSDPPMKFSHSIWMDPAIMKFVPLPKLSGSRAKIRQKVDKRFVDLDQRVTACPNVWGFQRNSWLTADNQFFLTDGACWGNLDSGRKKTGELKTVCTMLLGIRILRYLGARRIILVGVDFRMSPNSGYSFPQGRTPEACDSNNNQFKVVNSWLCRLEQGGVFKRFGLQLLNTYERSGLRAFPYIPFDQALEMAVGIVEEEPDLKGWYEKKNKDDGIPTDS